MFILGGQPALDPSHILQGLRYDPWWKSKVNSFRDVRGVYPSVGYLLMTKEATTKLVAANDGSPQEYLLEIAPFKGPFTEPIRRNVLISSIVEVNSGNKSSGSSACLVTLTDRRKYLEEAILHTTFNIVEAHTPINLIFNQDTIQPGDSANPSPRPYTWRNLVNYLWESALPNEPLVDILDNIYPDPPPCNIMCEGLSVADLLNAILNELGLTIYQRNISPPDFIITALAATDSSLNQDLIDGKYDTCLQEIRFADYDPHTLPPEEITFVFPNRDYVIYPNRNTLLPSPVDRFLQDPYYRATVHANSPYTYVNFDPNGSTRLFASIVAFFKDNESDQPANAADLAKYIQVVGANIVRVMASEYGPILTLQGFHNYRPNDKIAAVTYWENCTSSGNIAGAFTKIEVPNSAIYTTHPGYFFPRNDLKNFPHHKAIIVKPLSVIEPNSQGLATIVEYSVGSQGIDRKEEGTIHIYNLTNASLKTSIEYTADFHWQTQIYAIWPGTSPNQGSGSEGGADRLPVRFMLLEDMELTDTYQEAQLIDLQDRAINEDGDLVQGNPVPVPWTPFTAVLKGTRVLSPTDVFNQQAPFEKLWSQGDTIRSKVDRTTLNIFDTISGEVFFWEKSTGTGDGKILVLDLEKKRYGYKAYDDPKYGEQIGYRGTAYFVTDNYNDTGKPGYVIQDMEHEARILEGKLIEGTADDESNPKSFYMDVERYWGNAPNGRPPKTTKIQGSGSEEESEYGVKIICRLGESIPNSNDTSRAMLDEAEQVYVLMSNKIEFKSEYIVLELELEP